MIDLVFENAFARKFTHKLYVMFDVATYAQNSIGTRRNNTEKCVRCTWCENNLNSCLIRLLK